MIPLKFRLSSTKTKAIIIAVLAIIVIIAGFFIYKAYVGGPHEEKAARISKGTGIFQRRAIRQSSLVGDGATFTGLLNIINNYGGTDAANLANLYAGLSYANLNKWNDAVKYLG